MNGLLGPVTANRNMLAQALKSRNKLPMELKPVTTQGLLDNAALATSPVPFLGDAVGLGADAYRFATDAGSRTPMNFGLAALGALPFVPPAMAIFAGPLAKTAKLDKKALAEGMEAAGRSRDDIWKETGWFKGPEGKWKFEIDDSGSSVINAPVNKSWEQFSRDAELEKYGRNFQPSQMKAKDFKEYQKFRSELASAYDKTNATTRPLDQIYQHDLAAQAYPDVYGKLSARYDPSMGKGGSFAHSTISFGDASNKDGLRGLLSHEFQHAIQGAEGFAKGGMPESMAKVLDEQKLKNYLSKDESLTAQFEALKSQWQGKELPANVAEQVKKLRNEIESVRSTGIGLLKKRSAFGDTQYSSQELYDAYHKLAGEAEARAVQSRMNMTPQQRQATPPWQSYDVPWEQLIIK